MRHDLAIEGHAFRLRPIEDRDAQFVVDLRADETLNRFLHAGAETVANQLDWLARYYQRTDDYYFVVERHKSGSREGVISLYDVDEPMREAEWGRWIMRPGSLAAVESAWLIYRTAFEALDLNAVFCRTVAENSKVVSFHDSCEIEARRVLPQHFEIRGRRTDAIEHLVTREAWPRVGARLEALAQMIAKRIARE